MQVELNQMKVVSLPNKNSLLMHLDLRRVFVWAFLLSLFSLAVLQCSNIDWDFWWHLKAGQYIIESRSIPHIDPFSFTRAGHNGLLTNGCQKSLCTRSSTRVVGLVYFCSLVPPLLRPWEFAINAAKVSHSLQRWPSSS